jgi:hypothetical protein
VTPEKFQEKWEEATRTEKSAAQEHFLDLCELLGVPKPSDVDKHGKVYTFEKLTTRPDKGGKAFADVWRDKCFVWEYKGKRKSLTEAYAQARMYAADLGNPPLLIVSDMKEIIVYTNFTGLPTLRTSYTFRDLNDSAVRGRLKDAFLHPDRWRPDATRESVTREAAARFGKIAADLRRRGHDPQRVAHFLNRIVFCLFAEDIDLLPNRVFAEILEAATQDQDQFAPMLRDLFRAMRKKNGRFGSTSIPWFDGGLFEDDEVLGLGLLEIRELSDAAGLDWSFIDPSIFGTLFERGLDPEKRKAMAGLFDAPDTPASQRGLFDRHVPDKGVGIHYTDPATIMKIVEPVVLAPLRREWEAVKAEIRKHQQTKAKAKGAQRTRAENAARDAYMKFRERLGKFRVLDPACGSGNFLYLALSHLKDFDLAVMKDAEAMGLPLDNQRVTPEAVLGIEINPYAAEIARVTIWIGELQWQLKNGFGIKRAPILGQLKQIECRDALLAPDGTEADWSDADAVVGNPPFLGGKLMRKSIGDDYVDRLFAAYKGHVPAEADLVCYWFHKAWAMVREGRIRFAGLVATNSIRGGASRLLLDRIAHDGAIFDAWDDEAWVIDGAAVRVSLVCFTGKDQTPSVTLDGRSVNRINADLTSGDIDLTLAKQLPENADIAFMGDTKGGAFDIDGGTARKWLILPLNPNERPNADVLRPWFNGMDVTRRPADKWIVDFGWDMDESQAALYEVPFAHALQHVKPAREKNKRRSYKDIWWRHVEPRPGMWAALRRLSRYIATPTIAKYRLFCWIAASICPDHQLIVIARDDDTTFGILHSRFHEKWALRLGTSLEDRPRYTPSTTFETFPFPEGLTPNIPAKDYAADKRTIAIAAAANKLNELREAWLNPPDLVKRVPEVVPGFPDRILPVNDAAAATLKKRTLTNLYNERPAWLANAHRDLDAAVAAAYGWPADISDDDALARLFALNQERAKAR